MMENLIVGIITMVAILTIVFLIIIPTIEIIKKCKK